MSVATKLRLAFGAFVVVVAVSLTYHAYTIRRAARSARVMTEVASRSRLIASEQSIRLAEMRVGVSEYARTQAPADLERVLGLTRDYSVGLRQLDSLRIASEASEVATAARVARRSAAIAWSTTAIALLLAFSLSRMLLKSIENVARMKREFLSNVSHDLKTPLASMQETNAVLLEGIAGELNSKQRHLLALSQDSGARLQAMIAKLLELSRLESVKQPRFEVADLTQLARASARRFNDTAIARGISPRVHVRAKPEEIGARVDSDGIAHLFDNLIENAIKFSPADSSVDVALERRNGRIEISVADTGSGIPTEAKQRVFERFHQTALGRSVPSRGVGLGLAICRHVVETHGGTLRVTDNVPHGSVFVVSLTGSSSPRA